MFSRNFYTADDLFGYHQPRRHRYHNDASIDRYLRRREQENLEARRRQQELQERKLYERRYQQALAQRERELRERKRRQQLMRQKQQQQAEDEDDYEVDIVRGRDGNLYYVRRPVKSQHRRTISEEPHRSMREFHADPVIQEESEDEDDDQHHLYESTGSSREAGWDRTQTDLDSVASRITHGQNRREQSRKKKSKRRITVTVEDASDSECESEFDSPWRNRRPSPGQWIEPVEPYYG